MPANKSVIKKTSTKIQSKNSIKEVQPAVKNEEKSTNQNQGNFLSMILSKINIYLYVIKKFM